MARIDTLLSRNVAPASTQSPTTGSSARIDHELLDALIAEVEKVVLGKTHQVKLALACLLAEGHLLIEDLPGMGKTTLAHALAAVLGLSFNRIQFTSDLLPVDITGAAIFNTRDQRFDFKPGPVFAQLLLADEINRATPKAQSALLEAMEEHQVSSEGETYPLPEPFFVIATQNPAYQTGTFPLPESQLDRFLMRIELGYPDPEAERKILQGHRSRERLGQLTAQVSQAQFARLQDDVKGIHLSDPLLDYVQRLIACSRQQDDYVMGLSPRGALAIVRSAQAWALLEGRSYVIPEDVQTILPSVAEHRLRGDSLPGQARGLTLSRQLLDAVDVLE